RREGWRPLLELREGDRADELAERAVVAALWSAEGDVLGPDRELRDRRLVLGDDLRRDAGRVGDHVPRREHRGCRHVAGIDAERGELERREQRRIEGSGGGTVGAR